MGGVYLCCFVVSYSSVIFGVKVRAKKVIFLFRQCLQNINEVVHRKVERKGK